MSIAPLASLKNQLLIAMPSLNQGLFKSSVTYICEHDDDGAMGIIVNRPSSLSLRDVLNELEKSLDDDSQDRSDVDSEEKVDSFASTPVLVGGPVGMERGFVLHSTGADQRCWSSTLQVTEDIALTGSRDILQALSDGEGPEQYLVALGYAGWQAGQLEAELADNAWLTSPSTSDILFSTPFHRRASSAAALLGIDLSALATQAGNA